MDQDSNSIYWKGCRGGVGGCCSSRVVLQQQQHGNNTVAGVWQLMLLHRYCCFISRKGSCWSRAVVAPAATALLQHVSIYLTFISCIIGYLNVTRNYLQK